VPVAQLQALNLWDSDRLWIEMVFDDDYTFHGVAPYQAGKMVAWSVSKITR
jgi:8-oxo-dGTP diphosphatase